MQPFLVNEDAMGPEINPMKELYWKQFGGAPDSKMKWQMNPNRLINSNKKPTGKSKN